MHFLPQGMLTVSVCWRGGGGWCQPLSIEYLLNDCLAIAGLCGQT